MHPIIVWSSLNHHHTTLPFHRRLQLLPIFKIISGNDLSQVPELVVSLKPPTVEKLRFYYLILFVVFLKSPFQRARPTSG